MKQANSSVYRSNGEGAADGVIGKFPASAQRLVDLPLGPHGSEGGDIVALKVENVAPSVCAGDRATDLAFGAFDHLR